MKPFKNFLSPIASAQLNTAMTSTMALRKRCLNGLVADIARTRSVLGHNGIDGNNARRNKQTSVTSAAVYISDMRFVHSKSVRLGESCARRGPVITREAVPRTTSGTPRIDGLIETDSRFPTTY